LVSFLSFVVSSRYVIAMLRDDVIRALGEVVGPGRVWLDAPLAPFTTFRVGGPADCLAEARTSAELAQLVHLARREALPVTILAGGSNVVVSDAGVRGLVIRVHGGRIADEGPSSGLVRADAGATMNALVRWTIGRGYAGLEAWAGTPGTVGGAVFGNAHYGGRNISEFLVSVQYLGVGDEVLEAPAADLGFAYDTSRFQAGSEVILSAVFALRPGADPATLRGVAHASLAYRKRTQPLSAPSAGCAFQNPDPARDRVPAGMPASAGALVDRAGLKGCAVGGATVSTAHGNFIVSDGRATAADIRSLVRRCQAEVRRQFGVELREEIRWVGEFEDDNDSVFPKR
jgi:UDP-N-acetylmuramate dehydrogenase